MPSFFILKAVKDILQHLKFVNSWFRFFLLITLLQSFFILFWKINQIPRPKSNSTQCKGGLFQEY